MHHQILSVGAESIHAAKLVALPYVKVDEALELPAKIVLLTEK